jgi:hypothetical protein
MRKLVIEIIIANTIPKAIKIIEQTGRRSKFSDSLTFIHNDFVLKSVNVPAAMENGKDYGCKHGLYVRGSDGYADKRIIYIPSYEWLERLKDTVYAYNKTFSDGEEIKIEDVIKESRDDSNTFMNHCVKGTRTPIDIINDDYLVDLT